MKKYCIGFALLFGVLFGSVSAQSEALPKCPTMADIKACKTLGIFNRSAEFQGYQATAVEMCNRSMQGLNGFKALEKALTENEKKSLATDLNQKFIFGVTIFKNTVDGCSKKSFEQSADIFKTLYSRIEQFAVDKVNRSGADISSTEVKIKFLSALKDEDLRTRFLELINSSEFSSIPSSKNVFSSGDGKILGYKSKLKDYTGEGKTGNSQLRSILNNLFTGIKKILIPISIFLIVFAGVQLFLIARSSVPEEIPKKRNQVFNILIGWSVFSVAFTVVDFVVFGNGKENFIFRDNFQDTPDGGKYQIDEERSLNFAQRIFGETEGLADFFLTLFVIISILFLIISCIRLVFGDDESYEATKKQVMQSVLASVVAISLKPLLGLFYQNGKVVKPNATSVIEFALKWADYVLGFIGLLATISLIYGGIRLIIDYGNGEAMDKAKEIIKYSVIGIILAFSAWSIVNFFATPGEQVTAFVVNMV